MCIRVKFAVGCCKYVILVSSDEYGLHLASYLGIRAEFCIFCGGRKMRFQKRAGTAHSDEGRTVKSTFGSKRESGIGEWIKLRNQEFHNLYASSNTIRVTKSMRTRWVRHVACFEEIASYT
jgi:hypothetical protein